MALERSAPAFLAFSVTRPRFLARSFATPLALVRAGPTRAPRTALPVFVSTTLTLKRRPRRTLVGPDRPRYSSVACETNAQGTSSPALTCTSQRPAVGGCPINTEGQNAFAPPVSVPIWSTRKSENWSFQLPSHATASSSALVTVGPGVAL